MLQKLSFMDFIFHVSGFIQHFLDPLILNVLKPPSWFDSRLGSRHFSRSDIKFFAWFYSEPEFRGSKHSFKKNFNFFFIIWGLRNCFRNLKAYLYAIFFEIFKDQSQCFIRLNSNPILILLKKNIAGHIWLYV